MSTMEKEQSKPPASNTFFTDNHSPEREGERGQTGLQPAPPSSKPFSVHTINVEPETERGKDTASESQTKGRVEVASPGGNHKTASTNEIVGNATKKEEHRIVKIKIDDVCDQRETVNRETGGAITGKGIGIQMQMKGDAKLESVKDVQNEDGSTEEIDDLKSKSLPLSSSMKDLMEEERMKSIHAPVLALPPEHRRSQSITAELQKVNQNLLSPQRPKIKRRETVDTSTITREEHEDYSMVNQYKVVDIIGHGAYGIVHKATDSQNGKTYAIKIVGKKKIMRKKMPFRRPRGGPAPDPLAGLRKEIAILKKLDHPNIVKLVEVLEDSNEDDLMLVFEYIKNGPVMEDIDEQFAVSEAKAREYFIDLILGLEYLHSCKVVHRDIKPENLLLDDYDRIKIADFGVSENWSSEETDASLHSSAGTPAFTAPETLDGVRSVFGGRALDVWAAGATLYCLIYGRVPFVGRSVPELHEKILTQEIKFPDEIPISEDLKDLLLKLLEKDPVERITIPQIRKHAWFLGTDRYIPSINENCTCDSIDPTEEDIADAVQQFQTPIHILVMIKNMAKKKSLRNPYGVSDSPSVSPCVSPRQTRRPPTTTGEGGGGGGEKKDGISQVDKQRMFAAMKTIPTISISEDDGTLHLKT